MSDKFFYDSNRILQPEFGVSFRTTLMKGYYFLNGDEAFYTFMGKNSALSLTELLWEEDIAGFVEALDGLSQGPQVFLGKIKAGDGSYYSLFFMLTQSDKVVDDFKIIDVDMLDFRGLKERYANYLANTKKFSSIFSMLPHLYFEYTVDTDILVVYRYLNQNPSIVFEKKMKSFIDQILSDVSLAQEEKISIFNFYENLKDDGEYFETEMSSRVINKVHTTGFYKFRSVSFYEGDIKTKKIGIIERVADDNRKIKYYLTENAYDTGTGIFNKRAINEYANEKIQEATAENRSLYFAVFDIDDFKIFNDTYGHMFGDRVLSRISDILRSDLNFRGSCGRFGGDEFLVIFDRIKDEEELRNLIKTIRKNISFAFIEGDKSINVTTSWGISKFPDDGKNFETLFEKADKSLYIAKEKGKDRFIIYRENKHADIAITDNEKRRVGFHILANNVEKGKVVTDIILKLNKNGTEEIETVLETMREYFDIDGIAIYKGDELKRIYENGKYVEPIMNLTFAKNREYQELFDENGIIEETLLIRMKSIIGDDYSLLEKQEVGKLIQCKAGENDKMTIVSFDFFNRSPKISETDFSFIGMVGAMIANVVSQE